MKPDTGDRHTRIDRPHLQVALLVLTTLLLFGCAHTPQAPKEATQRKVTQGEVAQGEVTQEDTAHTAQSEPTSPPTPRFTLMTPSQLGDTPLRLQRLSVSRPDQKRTLLAQWQIRSGRLSLEALTPLGLPLLSLSYANDQQLTTKTYIPIPEGLSAERVIADLQWAYWPEQALREALQSGYQMIHHHKQCTQGHNCRQLWYQNQLISEVDYLDQRHDTLVIIDHQYDYQLHITTLTEAP